MTMAWSKGAGNVRKKLKWALTGKVSDLLAGHVCTEMRPSQPGRPCEEVSSSLWAATTNTSHSYHRENILAFYLCCFSASTTGCWFFPCVYHFAYKHQRRISNCLQTNVFQNAPGWKYHSSPLMSWWRGGPGKPWDKAKGLNETTESSYDSGPLTHRLWESFPGVVAFCPAEDLEGSWGLPLAFMVEVGGGRLIEYL